MACFATSPTMGRLPHAWPRFHSRKSASITWVNSSRTRAESGPFGPAPESSGPDRTRDPTAGQCSLDVTASVFEGRLRVEFTYSDAQFAAETIEMLADLFIQSLRELIQHCLSPEAGGYSASDFTDAGLTAEGVQDLLLELGEIDD